MGRGIEARKNTLVKVIHATIAVINGWEEWDLPAKLIASMPRRLVAVRLVKKKQTKYWTLFSISRAFIWAINYQYWIWIGRDNVDENRGCENNR